MQSWWLVPFPPPVSPLSPLASSVAPLLPVPESPEGSAAFDGLSAAGAELDGPADWSSSPEGWQAVAASRAATTPAPRRVLRSVRRTEPDLNVPEFMVQSSSPVTGPRVGLCASDTGECDRGRAVRSRGIRICYRSRMNRRP